MNDPNLPSDIASCHRMILHLQSELVQTRRRLEEHEGNERRRMEYLYGKGATPEKILRAGLMMSGRAELSRAGHCDDPNVGELYLRAKAQERAARRKKK